MYFLCNRPDMSQIWVKEQFIEYLHPDTNILICNFYQDDEWSGNLQSHQQRNVLHFVRSLDDIGISRSQLTIVHPQSKTIQEVHHLIQNANIIFIAGDTPESVMRCIREYQMERLLKNFDGLIIFDAIASLVALDEFSSSYDPYEKYPGLQLISSFLLDSLYVEDVQHLGRIVRLLEDQEKPIVAFDHSGGVVYDNGQYTLLGNAFIVDENDLDALYRAYYDAKERYEYYGDNGNY